MGVDAHALYVCLIRVLFKLLAAGGTYMLHFGCQGKAKTMCIVHTGGLDHANLVKFFVI